ncbi:GATA-binding factor 6-B [Amphibalanus amphitrite]|uniref:GATA-binding factor 6-B n=1 Tax=Amphibalanus amphitrite TaxID=1232801 RepID=A0A6A4W3J8_AMPAM|nr:GATA-binding factor 6-B [Amphibalanus amphitrite]
MYHGAVHGGAGYGLESSGAGAGGSSGGGGGGGGGYLSGGVCVPPAHQLFGLQHMTGQTSHMATPPTGVTGTACNSWQGGTVPACSEPAHPQLGMNFGGFKLTGGRDMTHSGLAQALPRHYGYPAGNMMAWPCNNMAGLQSLQRGTYEFRECVQCGTVTQSCYPDGTGHFLCSACFCNPKWKGIAHPRLFNTRRGSPYARRFHSMCTNCGTTQTTLWRRNNEGD